MPTLATRPERISSFPSGRPALRQVAHELESIEKHVRSLERRMRGALERVEPLYRESARNLVHYVALRQLDLRKLQIVLQELGLSSLGRSESFVLGSVLEVLARLRESLVAHGEAEPRDLEQLAARRGDALSWETARYLAHRHTTEILGPRPADRHVYVMVTAPGAAEADRAWMARMLRAGMDLLRINCAHEESAGWQLMLDALADARRETGRDCRVLMDLAGPKIRTGPMAQGVRVVSFRTEKNELGELVAPARVPIRARRTDGDGPCLEVSAAELHALAPGDELWLRDTRDKKRRLVVKEATPKGAFAECDQRVYLREGTPLRHMRGDKRRQKLVAHIGGASAGFVELAVGDLVHVTGRNVMGRGAPRDERGRAQRPLLVPCTLPKALEGVRPGHRILFDDGKIEALVEKVSLPDVTARVVRTNKPRTRLRAEKGINLPDSTLAIPSLGADDHTALAFAAQHADLVGMSFVRSAEDVRALHQALPNGGRRGPGIVLKIETRAGFEALPRILLEALRRPPVAVMIARGDLAVEAGYERLAELQEEILWLCEASHVPAIWATQVLDQLARTGVPSRAEVSDAAMSVAAECVMLNKGPFVEEAVKVLSDILRRMEKHHYKKRSIFRKLAVSALD